MATENENLVVKHTDAEALVASRMVTAFNVVLHQYYQRGEIDHETVHAVLDEATAAYVMLHYGILQEQEDGTITIHEDKLADAEAKGFVKRVSEVGDDDLVVGD